MKRKSNIELLRIISMVMVILSHYSKFSKFNFENVLSMNALIVKFFHAGGKIGVTIFIFISSYFLCTSQKFNLQKQVRLILEVLFYDLLIILASLFIGIYNTPDAIKQLFSIMLMLQPFINGYLAMVFLSPFINKLLNSLKLEEHIKLALLLLLIMYILPTFIPAMKINSEEIYFLAIYIFAALYKKCENNIQFGFKKSIALALLSIFLILLSEFALTYLGVKLNMQILIKDSEYFRNMFSILVLSSSIGLFMAFHSAKIKDSKIINSLASACFAVFLVHNGRLIRGFIWNNIFKTYTYENSKLLILNALIAVISIYLTVYIIDLFRQKLEVIIMNKLSPKIEKIQNKFENMIDKLGTRLAK